MHLQKLSDTLKQLEKVQLKRFQAFMYSPYFGYSEKASMLLDYLASIHPEYNEKNLNPEHISKKIPDIGTKKTQANLGSELMGAFEKFVAVDEWQRDERQVAYDTLRGYKFLGLNDEAIEFFNAEFARIEKDKYLTLEDLQLKYKLIDYSGKGLKSLIFKYDLVDPKLTLQALDEYYALVKTQLHIEILTWKIFNGTDNVPLDEETHFKVLEKYLNTNYPIIYATVNLYKALNAASTNDIIKYYNIVKHIFQTNDFPQKVSIALYNINLTCSNTCLILCNTGHLEWVDEYIWWIEWRDKKGVLIETNNIRPDIFLNVFINCNYSKRDFSWFKDFANRYQKYLPDSHRENYTTIVRGLLLLKEKKYKEASEHFDRIKEKYDTIFNCMIRRFYFMSAYELINNQYNQDLDIFLKSFSKYISRNIDLMRGRQSFFEDFISHCSKLINSDTFEKVSKLISKMEQYHYFPAKYWILEKAKEKARVLSTQAYRARGI